MAASQQVQRSHHSQLAESARSSLEQEISFTPCVLIPCFDHHRHLVEIIARLESQHLRTVIVDDGSHDDTRTVLHQLEQSSTSVYVIRHRENRGKGAAVKTGLTWARNVGYSHCVQIDADGQHDIEDVVRLLDVARQHPTWLISGAPVFDSSAPLIRRWGRLLSVVLVWIETRSTLLRDPLCGFRVYPVRESLQVVESKKIGDRMGFDPEIAVQMQWAGIGVVSVPTKVVYPPGNTSHFRYLRDNVGMFILHCTLLTRSLFPKSKRT